MLALVYIHPMNRILTFISLVFCVVYLNADLMIYSESIFSTTKVWMSPCNPASLEIEIKKVQVFGSNYDILIGTIGPVHIDKNNRVFIGDSDQTKVHVFLKNGTFLTSIGREGRGPGDFSAITWRTSIASDSNHLFITDTQSFNPNRANVYNLEDLKISHVLKLYADNIDDYSYLKGYAPEQLYPLSSEEILVKYTQLIQNSGTETGSIYYMVQNKHGEIISQSIYQQEGTGYLKETVSNNTNKMEVLHIFPFQARSLFSSAPNDFYYASSSEKFRIEVLDKTGRRIKIIEHPFENQKLSRKKLIKRYKEINYMPQLGEGVAIKMLEKSENLPPVWPALQQMIVDDRNRIWVATIVEDFPIYEWWILESSGDVVSKFKWPRDRPIVQIAGDHFYTKEKADATSDIVVKYSYQLN